MSCRVSNCPQKHNKHYCKFCEDTNSNHFSRNCPKASIVYHGTKKQFADGILKTGFKKSQNGRIGSGVYFTLNFDEAKNIAQHRFGHRNPVVIECFAVAEYKDFNYHDSAEEMKRKLDEWIQFSKSTAKGGIHPPWANNQEFKEVCLRNPETISIVKVHNV